MLDRAGEEPTVAGTDFLVSMDLSKVRGCLLAGPGRGDCEHFVGIPDEVVYPDTVDEYNVPNGWCIVCWHSVQLTDLEHQVTTVGDQLRSLRLGANEALLAADRARWASKSGTQPYVMAQRAVDVLKEHLQGHHPTGGEVPEIGSIECHELSECCDCCHSLMELVRSIR